MNKPIASSESTKESLGVFDVVCIILGVIIGSAIFKTPSTIAALLGAPWLILCVWAAGGALSLVGGLCYAELASAYPKERGEYFYLTRAYGPWAGFLFAWARLAVIHTGNIASMAAIAAIYMAQFYSFAYCEIVYAVASIVLFTVINSIGLQQGKWMQNILSSVKVIGLVLIVIAVFSLPGAPQPEAPSGPMELTFGAFFLAMVFVQFTFGGWSDCAFVTVEMRNPQRNVLRSMVIGIVLVTVIYMGVNVALLWGLGAQGMIASDAVVADYTALAWGEWGRRAVSALVIASALGAVNGMTLTGGRLFMTLGRDYKIFSALGKGVTANNAPLGALWAQCVISVVLVASGSFESLVTYTAGAHWLFLLLVGVSVFILRRIDPDVERPYRVHGYPVVPLIFIATSGMLLYSALDYAGWSSLIGFGLVLFGLVLYWVNRGMATSK
ncbi:amino acid permease [bacterium]|nr:amino acid permease [bacterium]